MTLLFISAYVFNEINNLIDIDNQMKQRIVEIVLAQVV